MKTTVVNFTILFLAVAAAGFLQMLNSAAVSIRFRNMSALLQGADDLERSVDHISLIATYEIHRKIYEERLTRDEADSLEHSLALQTAEADGGTRAKGQAPVSVLEVPALALMNFNRMILGKPPVELGAVSSANVRELDLAYYQERNFMFGKAAASYARALELREVSGAVRAGVLLRQGYCYALSGKTANAERNYRKVISEYPQANSSVTASILLKYLRGFSETERRILSGGKDGLWKSRKLVELFAYGAALDIIDSMESSVPELHRASLKYYRARCYSGMGKPQKAAEEYLSVITSSPMSPYARYANRKLFMIASSAGNSRELLETSVRLNETLKDPVLGSMIEKQKEAGLPEPEKTGDEALSVKTPENMEKAVSDVIQLRRSEVVRYVTVVTRDGNTFKGRIVKKDDDTISIETSIGLIDIKRELVQKIKDE